MVFISQLQKETLLKVNDLINEGKTFDEIWWELQKSGYDFIVEGKNGYFSKTHTKLYKDNQYSFVELVKRRNGKATWETWKIS